jgi:hypothetical protein
MNGTTARRDIIANSRTMTELEDQTIVNYVLDLDSRGCPPAIAHVEAMANNLRNSRDATRVGTRWTYRFINRHLEFKIRWNHLYDYRKDLCENPKVIQGWFRLIANIIIKYRIRDKTGFMMGKISASMIVTSAKRRKKAKQLQ